VAFHTAAEVEKEEGERSGDCWGKGGAMRFDKTASLRHLVEWNFIPFVPFAVRILWE